MNKRVFRYLLIIVALALTWQAVGATEFDLEKIYDGFIRKPYFGQFLSGFFPLNWDIMPEVLSQTWLTIQMAWMGTLIATAISLPLSFMAARNLTPAPAVGASIRFFFNADRSIDVMIVAIVIVVAVGFGPLAGTLAIALSAVGSMGKLFTEAIEAVDRGPVEALESVGATRPQIVMRGVVPQVMPYLISYFLYRLELNIRSALVLGIVGAGGIGQTLYQDVKQFQYQEAAMILVVIVVLVMTIDGVSARLRRAVV